MYLKNEDTICAPATIPGTGAISIIRVSGPEALAIADKIISCKKSGQNSTTADCMHKEAASSDGPISKSKGYTIRFGTVAGPDGRPLDEVLVSIFKAPHSYTGENSVEISCHASSYIVSSILELLFAAGARLAEPGEFTLRAYLNGKMDLSQAEAVADLIASQNAAAHRIAFSQMKGGFSSELLLMRSELLNIVSLMELELDFSEEDVEFADRSQLNSLIDRVLEHIGRLMDSFRLGNAIKNGIPVAIVGATNAGKSTLLNALLGEERAIVSDIHGTTRDTIEETLNIDGVLYRFIDTAGIRETSEVVERIGIERTFKKLSEAEIVIGMIDGTKSQDSISRDLSDLLSRVNPNEQKIIIIVNKADIWGAPIHQNMSDMQDFSCNKNVLMLNKIVLLIDNLTSKNNNDQKAKICHSIPAEQVILDSPLPESQNPDTRQDTDYSASPISRAQYSPAENFGNYNVKQSVIRINGQGITAIAISAKTGAGIDTLRQTLSSYSKDRLEDSDTTLVTNARHYQALCDAHTSLSRVKFGLSEGIPTDLVSQDIREALSHLGDILGIISTQDVLNNVFKNFCIGK